MQEAIERLKDLKNYTELSVPFHNSDYYYNQINSELNNCVGTNKWFAEKETELKLRSTKMFKENQDKRYVESRAKHEQFKNDIALVNGLDNHPKLDDLWQKAWEHGHSCGLHEVRYYFEDLMELIK